ncbi:hypothetical protein EON79_14755, partial [bacterium]
MKPFAPLTSLLALVPLSVCAMEARIDRHALVTRHNVRLTAFDGQNPLQVGNGEFAFGMDVTGLQTFAPFNTMSQWGWHSSPLPTGQRAEDYRQQVRDTHGRPVRYPLPDPERPELSDWLAANPHRINLGRIGLAMTKADGSPATEKDIRHPKQELDLWNGIVTSRFELEGQPVTVKTACHPALDAVAARVESPLIRAGRLAVFLDAPGNNPLQFANSVGDWTQPGRYEVVRSQPKRMDLSQRIDATAIHVGLAWDGKATLRKPEPGAPIQVLKAEYGTGDK